MKNADDQRGAFGDREGVPDTVDPHGDRQNIRKRKNDQDLSCEGDDQARHAVAQRLHEIGRAHV